MSVALASGRCTRLSRGVGSGVRLGDAADQAIINDDVAKLQRRRLEGRSPPAPALEAARSHMRIAEELADAEYPREVGPGVYDIHSPRAPNAEEAADLIREALQAIPAERLWVNPDCGLKTRGWPEVRASLENLAAAARAVRNTLPSDSS
ncbi:hypothetical protein [Actinoallomurus sp. CA-150999]|uniref:hypothetical protein n=1 Tax=Actinoallomurus sp. CA-150999 TaxID=3239887 RepID=UPI003D92A348